MSEAEVEQIAQGITADPEKQKWLRRVIREASGACWIVPDDLLRSVRPSQLRGMIRRRRNQAEAILSMLKEASGSKTGPHTVDNDPLG